MQQTGPEAIFDRYTDDQQLEPHRISYPSPLGQRCSEPDFRARLNERKFGLIVGYRCHDRTVVFGIDEDVFPRMAATTLRDAPGVQELQFEWIIALRKNPQVLLGALLDTEPISPAAQSCPEALSESVRQALRMTGASA